MKLSDRAEEILEALWIAVEEKGRGYAERDKIRIAEDDPAYEELTSLAYIEVKEGRVGSGQFAALGWLLEKNGFYGLRVDYSRNVTDATFERTRVTRDGKRYEVENYADAGPFELWVVQRAIKGVASSIEWEKPTTWSECPKWDKPQVAQHE